MNLVRAYFLTQRGVDRLVTLDQAFAFEGYGHHGRVPMASIAVDDQMLAGQARRNQLLQLFGCHGWGLI